MKSIKIYRIEISTNGTINFSYNCLADSQKVVFYEKDILNLTFFRRPTKNQIVQNLTYTSYKSKYKF